MYEWNLRDFEKKLPSKEFIEKAHNALLYERDSEGGITRLRFREGKCKKLIEEILPISVFLKCFERIGLDLYCEYFYGNQNFDAKIYCGGLLVEKQSFKNEYFLEVSIACHPKDYLKRECLEKGLPSFGGDDIERLKNGTIKSSPEVSDPDKLIETHFDFIKSRIEGKNKIQYPSNTYLIIPLFPDTLITQDEWIEIVCRLASIENILSKLCGLFIYDEISNRMVLI
jgi:hypothetical protein